MNVLDKLVEIKNIEHKGIQITVKIDYNQKIISLVENQGNYGRKDWRFTDRELTYMKGWQNILDAMKNAIKVAEKDLEEYEDAYHAKLVEAAVEIDKLKE